MRRSADERRSEILRAAVALFEQNGFAATSVEEITAKAKISKGLAYHYFKSKDEILVALIGMRLAELDDLTRRLRAEPSAERRLQILIDQLLDDVISGEKRQRFLITTFLQPQNNKLVQKAMKASPERFESLQQEEIRLLADLGFSYRAAAGGFDHPTQTTIVDRNGKVYRHVYGEAFPLRMFMEPMKDVVYGTSTPFTLTGIVDRIKFICTSYDPGAGRYRIDYGLVFGSVLAAISLLAMGGLLLREWRRAGHAPTGKA